MFKKFLIILTVLFLIASLTFLGLFIHEQYLLKQENQLYEDLIEEVVIKENILPETNTDVLSEPSKINENSSGASSDNKTKTKYKIDFKALKKKNKDVGGWVCLENSKINYPVLLSEGNYYLKKDINKKNSTSGSIYTYNNQSFFSFEKLDKNVILYGHNMKNGTMFSYLNTLLANPNSLINQKHKNIYLYTENQTYQYKIFSVYKTSKTDNFNQIYFKNNDEFLKFCNTIQNKSVFKGNTTFKEDDRIITLVTCPNSNSENYRTVVHAVLVKYN